MLMGALVYSQEKTATLPESFALTVTSCERTPKSWKEEVYASARAIAQRAQKPITLCFSGGLDSEIMCRAFFDQGINISVLTIEHAKNANKFDVDHARSWCWDRGIPHEILALDTKRFIENDVDAMAAEGFVSRNVMSYFEFFLVRTVEKSGRLAVLGSGAPVYRGDPARADTYMRFTRGEKAIVEWCEKTRSGHEPFFFRSTPELWAAQLQVPIVAYAVKNPTLFYNAFSGLGFKRFVHHAEWPEASARPYYSPFGTFRPLRLKKEAELRTRFGQEGAIVDVSLSEIERTLMPRSLQSLA